MDAKHLGVPQSRPRTIFVGVRNDLWKDEYEGLSHPKPLDYKVNLKQSFKGLVFTDKDKIETDMSRYAVYKFLINLKPGEQHKKRFSLFKENQFSYTHCITATTGNIGAAHSCHWDNRAFTVNEIKRIMSIPDDYILTGKYQQKVERLGRMVAPFMMRAVADNIYNLVLKNENT